MHGAPQRLFREVGHPFVKIRSAKDSPHFGVHGGLGERDLLWIFVAYLFLAPTSTNHDAYPAL